MVYAKPVHSLLTSTSAQSQLFNAADLIVLQELPMSNLAVFETINEVPQLCTGCNKPFGGKTILGIGDFCQVAPVIPGAGPSETLEASIKSSLLGSKFSVLSLFTLWHFGNDKICVTL
jgi:hypothetical protein